MEEKPKKYTHLSSSRHWRGGDRPSVRGPSRGVTMAVSMAGITMAVSMADTRGVTITADTMAGHTRADDTTGGTVTGVIISRPDSEDHHQPSDETKSMITCFLLVFTLVTSYTYN